MSEVVHGPTFLISTRIVNTKKKTLDMLKQTYVTKKIRCDIFSSKQDVPGCLTLVQTRYHATQHN
jgi:hypothetical protein